MTAPIDSAAEYLARLPAVPDMPARIGRLAAFDGVILEATGLDLPVGAHARIRTRSGRWTEAEVVGFRGDHVMLMPLGSGGDHAGGARVEPVRADDMVAAGPQLLGRVVDALGRPLDGLGPVEAEARWPTGGVSANPLDRARVTQPFDVGVRAINALHTMGRGQRIALIAGAGVGKSVLMGQMLAGARVDAVVVGLIGERSREVSDFVATHLAGEARARSVVVAVPADHAPLLRLKAAMRATAIAEEMRARGLNVLLLIDSLTRIAHAQREIGLSLGEPPTARGYPPSALGLIPRLIERAGADGRTGGAITAVYTVLVDGDPGDDPVAEAARAITDGHVLLSRPLAEQGLFPAIDIAASLSRVMSDVADAEHRAMAAAARRLWSLHEGNRDLVMMGAYAPGADPALDEAIARHDDIRDFIAQPAGASVDLPSSIEALAALEIGA